ncbi:hypothetical protein C8R44DRAFT_819028 [Mycena epipterygia]|nr:hypothetical protein C8R44DRAFT_819028 [Mycena epipterygia]
MSSSVLLFTAVDEISSAFVRTDSGISIAVHAPNGKDVAQPQQGRIDGNEASSSDSSVGQKRAQADPPDANRPEGKRARSSR